MALDLSINRESNAYLAFVVGLKSYCNRHLQGAVQAQYEDLAAGYRQNQADHAPQSLEEVAGLVEPLPAYQTNRLLGRKAQEMMWAGIERAYRGREAEILAELDRPESESLGSLELNPHLPLPEYYQTHEFHIQPGSYHTQRMGGVVYNMGQQIYTQPTHNKAQNQLGVAEVFGTPPTLDPTKVRILVMGCGFGTTTWPFCQLYPQAEIWGIDLSAPGLKVGHKKAQTLGYRVHFRQQDTAHTSFEDASFDFVLAHALFHELPKPILRQTVAEAHRILKPGGTFIVSDLTPYRELSPWGQFVTDWQVEHNGEPFWRSTLRETHLPTVFGEAGFETVEERPLKPSVKFPWLTIGRK